MFCSEFEMSSGALHILFSSERIRLVYHKEAQQEESDEISCMDSLCLIVGENHIDSFFLAGLCAICVEFSQESALIPESSFGRIAKYSTVNLSRRSASC